MEPVATTETKPSFGARMAAAKQAKQAKQAKPATKKAKQAKPLKVHPDFVVNEHAKARTTEIDSSQFKIPQPAPQNIPALGQPMPNPNRASSMIHAVDSPLDPEYVKALQFAEDAVVIMLAQSSERHASEWKDCWVNGKGIEVFKDGRWQEFKAIPRGKRVMTKRKYVEVLARAKEDNITTKPIQHRDHEENLILHNVIMTSGITILHDPAGVAPGTKGYEWFEKMIAA